MAFLGDTQSNTIGLDVSMYAGGLHGGEGSLIALPKTTPGTRAAATAGQLTWFSTKRPRQCRVLPRSSIPRSSFGLLSSAAGCVRERRGHARWLV